jgi:hypothetical protein
MKNNLIAILVGLLFVGGLLAGCTSSNEDSTGGTGTGADSGANQKEPEKPVVDTDAGSSTDTGSTDTGTTGTGTDTGSTGSTDTGTTDAGAAGSGTTDTSGSGKAEGGGGTGM